MFKQDFAELDEPILLKISISQETTEVVPAFQVLVYISRNNSKFKEKLLKEDVLSSICHVFEVFSGDWDVLKQAVILLGTLADNYPLAAYQCIVEEIHLNLLHFLKEFGECFALLEVTIETVGRSFFAQITSKDIQNTKSYNKQKKHTNGLPKE